MSTENSNTENSNDLFQLYVSPTTTVDIPLNFRILPIKFVEIPIEFVFDPNIKAIKPVKFYSIPVEYVLQRTIFQKVTTLGNHPP